MTDIKCRYTVPYCYYGYSPVRLHHDVFWNCDSEYECIGEYHPSSGTKVINPQCTHCIYISGEFEKTVKRYEYEDGILTVAGKKYSEDEIDYLEIDGRVLIDECGEDMREEQDDKN